MTNGVNASKLNSSGMDGFACGAWTACKPIVLQTFKLQTNHNR
ncbi:hypothetical protein [Carnobacterium sp.]